MKRRTVKKVLSTALVGTMALSLMAGCSTKKESTKKVVKENEGESSEGYSGNVVIYPLGAGHNEALYDAIEVLKGMEKYKDVTFDVKFDNDESTKDKIPTYIAGGEQVDIVYSGNPIYQQQYVDGGVIVPITEYVEKYGINMEEQYGEYAKFAYNAGEVYGIPGGATAWGLWYNKKIFDDAGIEYPDPKVPMTWEEYSELAKQLTKGSGSEKTYGALHLTWPMYWYGEAIMALGGGEQFYTEDGLSNIKDPAFGKAMERTWNMMNTDKSIRTNADIETAGITGQAFLDGHYGMMPSGSWVLNWLLDKETYPRDFEVGLAPMPVDSGTTPKNWGICGTFGLTPTTADPDLSFNVCVDLVRETTKLTSSEIYADQTVPQDNIFTDIVNQISEYDKLITVDLVHGIFLNPETQFVTEKISGPNAADYEKIVVEETTLYFGQEQDLNTTLDNIEQRVNEMLEK